MSAENAADLPLAGIRVLDVASYIAAPVAATILADFGADVIKIEAPAGDGCRRLHTMPGMPVSDRDYAWEVEHHFLEEYSHSSAPEVFLSAASQRTKNIRLGHGIVQLTTNQPHRVAERVATVSYTHLTLPTSG